jgi:hypothetical protein
MGSTLAKDVARAATVASNFEQGFNLSLAGVHDGLTPDAQDGLHAAGLAQKAWLHQKERLALINKSSVWKGQLGPGTDSQRLRLKDYIWRASWFPAEDDPAHAILNQVLERAEQCCVPTFMQLSKQRQPAVRHRQRLVQIISKPMQYGSSLSASALQPTFTKPICFGQESEFRLDIERRSIRRQLHRKARNSERHPSSGWGTHAARAVSGNSPSTLADIEPPWPCRRSQRSVHCR